MHYCKSCKFTASVSGANGWEAIVEKHALDEPVAITKIQPKMMITLESDHLEVVARLICNEVLGQRSSVSVAGRLGVEIMLGDIALDDLSRLRKALRANGHRVWTTRTRIK